MLIVFSGLPATGKTTLAKALARHMGALYVRLDSIEQALRDAGCEVGANGYRVANAVALGNLQLGNRVVVDCVNPVAESRQAWHDVAATAGVALLDVQVVCSDLAEHQRRTQSRTVDVPGLVPPSWASVLAHEYEPWLPAPFTVDTARLSVAEALAMIHQQLSTPTP
ncbi:AAA family ATPase [Pseudomonas sp. App30]|uniref:AAA family ATPase n=1 Tax=Pseudomonas sp. App30 TaxID=3068990 RepID=UPI003A80A925